MRHHVLSAALGIGLAAILVPMSVTAAAAAGPTGFWRKADQGQFPAKMQVYGCGSGGRYLCVKIAWMQNPNDSKGNPLRDIRNSNTSLRGREIVGLPIVRGMAKVSANQWKGNIYNPEDGNTYSATLTLASRNKIVLKGCKAFLLCAERVWLRTSPPPKPEPEVEAEPQIEASAEPAATPGTATAAAAPAPEANALKNAEMATPAAEQSVQPGYRYLNKAANTSAGPAGFAGDNVPSMFVMTTPIEHDGTSASGDGGAPAKAQTAAAPPAPKPTPVARPAPAPKPQSRPMQANAAPAPQPVAAPKPQAAPAPKQAAPAPQPRTAPEPVAAAEAEGEALVDEATEETETADAAVPSRAMTWRERRKLRRQQRQQGDGAFPWLR